MNIEHDIKEAGVQMILLVEDNIRFYSSVLPNLYNYILAQSKRFSTEALNPHAAAQRKRGRPKVVLATTYEEAMELYEKYHENTLGVISDTRFPMKVHEGRLSHVEEGDPEAGLKLLKEIRITRLVLRNHICQSESDPVWHLYDSLGLAPLGLAAINSRVGARIRAPPSEGK